MSLDKQVSEGLFSMAFCDTIHNSRKGLEGVSPTLIGDFYRGKWVPHHNEYQGVGLRTFSLCLRNSAVDASMDDDP